MPGEIHQYRYSTADPSTEYQRSQGLKDLHGLESICDLGSGNGHMAGRLGSLGYCVTGIDESISGVEIATRAFGTDKVRFFRSEIGPEHMRAHLECHSFDAVVSSDVIEHLYRPSDLIESAALLLKPGGYLIIGTPYHGYLKNLAISILDKWDSHHGVDWDGGHIKFFSVKTLGKLVSDHGFGKLAFHFHGRLPLLWKNMVCIARKAP